MGETCPETRRSGEKLFLFGDNHPEIAELIDDPGFRRLVRELYREERVAAPPELPLVERAVACGLLTREGGGLTPGPRLVTVPESADDGVLELMRPAMALYVEIAGEVIAEMREVFEGSAAARAFSWPDVRHALAAGMFLDLAMGREVVRGGEITRRPSGDCVVWAFERITPRNGYGVQWTPTGQPPVDEPTFYAQLWHLDVQRPNGRLSPRMADLLVRAARGEDLGDAAREALFLRHLGLLRRSGSRLEVRIPVFDPAVTERLLPILDAGGRRLVADAVAPALERLADHPWWGPRIDRQAYRHAAVRLVLEYGVDCVIASDVLAPFPAPEGLSPAWGRWIWAEPAGELSLMPSRVAEIEETPAREALAEGALAT